MSRKFHQNKSVHPDIMELIHEYFVRNNRDEAILKSIYITLGKVLLRNFQSRLMTKVITAEDIYNETWFAILDPNTPEYDPAKGPFIGYFIFIAKNMIRNWNTRKETTSSIDIEAVKEEIIEKLEPNKEIFNNELKIQFYNAINNLSDLQREIVIFRNLGLSYQEISQIFNVSEDSLKQRMYSAKKLLSKDPLLKKLFQTIKD